MAEVFIENVTKKYGDFTAINDLSLKIEDKEFVVILGPSGCGKTTLLRLIAGLEEITNGNIYIGGRVVNELAPKDRDIAMVFQSYALYPHMNVFENMSFGLRMKKYPIEEIKSRVKEAAELLGISDQLWKKPKELSGGQRQRVALGRAIVRKPAVFLMDEPLSNLDAKLRIRMRNELIQLHKKLDTTIIYVTHDQVEAMTLANRVAIMNKGKLQQYSKPLEAYYEPANRFVAEFVGTPSMNILDGKIMKKDGKTNFLFGNLKFPLALEINEQNAYFGIRPEDIKINKVGRGFKAIVVGLEVLGDKTFLYFKFGEKEVVAQTEAKYNWSIGEEVWVEFDLEKCHIFNEAGVRIG
ncbi:MAG: ABC transporter ATP-binding protein [Candidatus Thermoplasmatota archaeon]